MVATLTDRCPGVLHAVAARDGLLVRIRIPGGAIEVDQLRALAAAGERFGHGALDLTARAGVQVRGISPDSLAPFTDAIANIGFLASPAHDRVRNIIASPFAGYDPDELLDPAPVVRELDRRLLADPALAALPAKFAFAIDGGGRPFPYGRADLALRAVRHDGAALFALYVGGRRAQLALTPHRAAEALIEAARAVLPHVTPIASVPWRLDRCLAARDAILEAIAPYCTRLDAEAWPMLRQAQHDIVEERVPLGVLACAQHERVILAPSIPLGRLHHAQAEALAALATAHGAALRITPWRTITIVGYPRAALDVARSALDAAGLVLDGSDGYHGIAACAGLRGCTAALADVRAAADELARRLAVHAPHGRRINLAGCAKRCAMRGGATVDLVAEDDGYSVLLDGIATHRGLDEGAALARAVAAILQPRIPENP